MYKRKRSIDNSGYSLESWVGTVSKRKIKMSTYYRHETCAFPNCEAENKRQDFMFCGRCRVVVYCSKEHQQAHYKSHKSFCKVHEWAVDNSSLASAASSCPLPKCNCKKWHMSSSSSDNKVSQKSQNVPVTMNGESSFKQSENLNTVDSAISDSSEQSSLSKEEFSSLDSDFKKLKFHGRIRNQPESQFEANDVPVSNGNVKNAINRSTLKNGDKGDTELSSVNYSEQGSLSNSSNKRSKKNRLRKQPTSSQTAVIGEYKQASKPARNLEEDDLENYAPQCDEVVAVSESQCLVEEDEETHLSNSGVNVNTNASMNVSTLSSTANQETGIFVDSFGAANHMQSNNLSVFSNPTVPFQHRNNLQPLAGQTPQQNRAWMLQVCQQIIEDMDRFGVCVVDNLLGEARGGAVLREVQSMYSSGSFTDGQLVKGQRDAPGASQSIRGDKITWVDGKEPHCRNISILVKLLDNIIMGANSLGNNGKLGNYRIKERSKAMVACYPGSGTQYVKHVDNPNDDGRCVTAIYYLNKDWNTKENGGLLRIFPEGWLHEVADIEPLFDRVIFFWSDRRNPHEVQPAFKTRYAITLWYFDSNAKEQAKLRKEINTSTSVKAS